MKIALISALPDVASINLKQTLVSAYSFQGTEQLFDGNEQFTLDWHDHTLTLVTLTNKALLYNNLDQQISADLFIFLSKHVAKSGIPAFTCHSLGNWHNESTYGGYPHKMSASSPSLMRAMLRSLTSFCAVTGRDIVHEVTHHGPYLETPGIYVEIGSSLAEWEDSRAGALVTHAIMDVLASPIPLCTPAIGIGGLHTAPIFSRLTLTTTLGFAHMIPKHYLSALTHDLLHDAITKSTEPIAYLVLDWKSLTPHKELVKRVCSTFPIPVLRSDHVARYNLQG